MTIDEQKEIARKLPAMLGAGVERKPAPSMKPEDGKALIEKLPSMSRNDLKKLWTMLFGGACFTARVDWLRQRLEWRIKTLVNGGISERAMARASEIADETILRMSARAFTRRDAVPTDKIISKKYKGVVYEVIQKSDGFVYLGKHYATLTEVSTLIAGYFVSGNKFFNITPEKKK